MCVFACVCVCACVRACSSISTLFSLSLSLSFALPASIFEAKPAVSQDLTTPCQFKVVAMFAFQALEPTDLSLAPGEELEVLDSSQEHWWRARNQDGQAGMIPANYVRKPGIEAEP